MSRFNDRIEQDLGHIADRATPSPTAWEDIQTRMSEQVDQPEMELIMLQPNPPKPKPIKAWVLSAAAVALLIVGAAVLFSGSNDGTTVITDAPDTPEVAPTAEVEPAPEEDATSEEDAAAEDATASDEGITTEEPAVDLGPALSVATQFMEARNAYDGETAQSLIAPDSSVRDDLLAWSPVGANDANGNGRWLTNDEFDYVTNAEFERVTGVQFVEPDCNASQPGRSSTTRVVCTYEWENDWSRALDDHQYGNVRFLFEIADGQIQDLTHTFPVIIIPMVEGTGVQHVFSMFNIWLLQHHPDDMQFLFPRLSNTESIPSRAAETIPVWDTYTDEFVDFVNSETLDVALRFFAARNAYDAEATRALVADDAEFTDTQLVGQGGRDYLSADSIDFVASADFDRITGVQFLDPQCELTSAKNVSCTYNWENDWTRALADDQYSPVTFNFEIELLVPDDCDPSGTGPSSAPNLCSGGTRRGVAGLEFVSQIKSLVHAFPNTTSLADDAHMYWRVRDWLFANHADDASGKLNDLLVPHRTAETIPFWEANAAELVQYLTDLEAAS